MQACICQNLLDSVFADSEESLPPCVAGKVLVSVEVAVEGILVYPADLAPEGTPDEDFVSLIQELSHCGVCMEMRKGSSRYHRLFTLSLLSGLFQCTSLPVESLFFILQGL